MSSPIHASVSGTVKGIEYGLIRQVQKQNVSSLKMMGIRGNKRSYGETFW